MKVLKFGGTSVANAQNITLVKNIVSDVDADQTIVVVSAFGGVTDLLLQTADFAASQDLRYKTVLKEIEDRHIDTIKKLIPINKQSKALSKIKSDLNTLETGMDVLETAGGHAQEKDCQGTRRPSRAKQDVVRHGRQ